MKNLFLALFTSLFIIGCSSVKVSDYHNEKPDFDFFQFFNGHAQADGFFQDRSGKVKRRMHVEMRGRIEGQTLVVDEDFKYSDGTTSKRTWKFTKNEDGTISGNAPDVTGVERIESSGFAFNMKYSLQIPYGDSSIIVKMDDWMYRVSENQVINKTEMSKLGIRLGELTLIINKR